MNTTDTNIQTLAANMLITLSRAQLGMCDRALQLTAKATTPQRQAQLLHIVRQTGEFFSQFTTVEQLKEGLIDAIVTTETNAILAAEDDFLSFAITQFPNESGAATFLYEDIHNLFNRITDFHKSADNLENEWYTNA